MYPSLVIYPLWVDHRIRCFTHRRGGGNFTRGRPIYGYGKKTYVVGSRSTIYSTATPQLHYREVLPPLGTAQTARTGSINSR